MKKTKLPQRSFRPYRLHEMNDGQTTSNQWISHVDEQRSSVIDSDETCSKIDSHRWHRVEFPELPEVAKNDHQMDCLAKSIEIKAALTTAAYPLKNVDCQVEQNRVILSGRVRRYYYVQLVLRMAQRHCAGRKIINQIQVFPLEIDDLD